MKFPKMVRVEQRLESHKLDDPIGALEKEFDRVGFDKLIKPGERIAICAGSRGINHLPDFIKRTVEGVKAAGATPFIVPSMGSHGGATAEGQKEVLTHMGITEEYCGAEIKSSMETVRLGEADKGCAVRFDKFAYECDGVIPIARVKPHTDFKSEIESGLCKMLVIGLGKHAGAVAMHLFGLYGYMHTLPLVAKLQLEKANVRLGIGLVEDGFDDTAIVECVMPQDFHERDKALLLKAKEWMPSLPIDELDVLLVREHGKDISGSGMDPNIIGRMDKRLDERVFTHPRIRRIAVMDLSHRTNGNAIGIGYADFITQTVADQFDFHSTMMNALTSSAPEAGMLPLAFPTEKEVIERAVLSSFAHDLDALKMMYIKNTLHLDVLYVSEALVDVVREKRGEGATLGDPVEFTFDEEDKIALPL